MVFRYPWESAYSGVEVVPVPVYGENEQHITGDIAFALRTYLATTKDLSWLKDKSVLEFVLNMARFWESRPTFNESTQRWDINGES